MKWVCSKFTVTAEEPFLGCVFIKQTYIQSPEKISGPNKFQCFAEETLNSVFSVEEKVIIQRKSCIFDSDT